MLKRDSQSNAGLKRAAGERAADEVQDGMVVGLGTGSTAAWAIKRLGERVKEGLQILGVPTSYSSELLAIQSGIRITTLNQHPVLDLAIDGADQVDKNLDAIKGGGAAHTKEKIVSRSTRRFILVSDSSKYVQRLNVPVPVEVLPFALRLVEKMLIDIGGDPVLRLAKMKDGPVITDNGNLILDVSFGTIEDPGLISNAISIIPGVIEHGIFTNPDCLYLGSDSGVEFIARKVR